MMPTLASARQLESEQKQVQLVTFRIDRHQFAVPVEQVWRVEALADFALARVPGAPAFLEGLINLRGRVIPVIDLKKRMGFLSPEPEGEAAGYSPKARLLIVEMEVGEQTQQENKVAMLVDSGNDIRWFPAAHLHPAPPMVAEISSKYLLGVLEEEGSLWMVLDLRQVLSLEERTAVHAEANQASLDDLLPEAG
jgi:purine-binding chemotaxis protein CheW